MDDSPLGKPRPGSVQPLLPFGYRCTAPSDGKGKRKFSKAMEWALLPAAPDWASNAACSNPSSEGNEFVGIARSKTANTSKQARSCELGDSLGQRDSQRLLKPLSLQFQIS